MMKTTIKTLSTALCTMLSAASLAATYPRGIDTTTTNTWSRNFSGVMAAARETGYPVLMIVVNSATCSHCHTMIANTVNTAEFAQMEKDLTYYEVIMDAVGGSPEFGTVVNKYYRYFDSGMYPIVAVLRKDGTVYGAFGNRTTDRRGVATDLRQLIENLAVEQEADIWSGSGVEPFSVTPSATEEEKPTALTWAAKLKGKSNGIVFDSKQEIVGALEIRLNAKGKATIKHSTFYGRSIIRATLRLNGETPQLVADSMILSYDTSANVWSGGGEDYTAYASALPSTSFKGLYTSVATNTAASGYATVTVKSGKGRFGGMVGGKNKISANGAVVVLPAATVANGLEKWSVNSDLAFIPMIKTGKFSGGAAVSRNGKVAISIDAFDKEWSGSGAAWTGDTGLSALDGKVLKLMIGKDTFGVPIRALNDKKIAAGDNDIAARISAMSKKGIFRGNAKVSGVRYKFEGVLINDGKSISGIGTSYGGGVHKVEICDEE